MLFPIFIMLLIIVAWVKELRTDPYALRHRYADNAISQAVIDGVDKYGDNFALQVVPTEPGEGAGGTTDSAHDDYTGWYQRTDEDGDPVGYDFETGEWEDGWDPETGTIPVSEPKATDKPD